MRKYGFQARYVEGYIVLPGMSETSDETIDIDVPDKCAHAWTEVYLKDYGWVCVEFTPGYVNDNPNMTDEEKNPNKKQTPPDDSSSQPDSSSSSDSSSEASSSQQDSTLSIADQSSSNADSSPDSSSDVLSSSDNSTSENSNNSGGGTVVSTNDSGSSGIAPQDSKKPPSQKGPKGFSAGSTVIFAIVFLLVFAVVVVLRRILSLKTLESNCVEGNTKDRIQHILKYTVKYLKLIDVEGRGNITDMQLLEELKQKLNEMDIDISDKLEHIFVTAEEAYMGNHEISEESCSTAYGYMQDIAQKTVKPKLDPIKKFRAMFVNCLY